MPRMAILVSFTTRPGCFAAFEAALRAHAAATLAEEPGCERFEVLRPLAEDGTPLADRIELFEQYASAEAVAAHRANPRMAQVSATITPLLAARALTLCQMG